MRFCIFYLFIIGLLCSCSKPQVDYTLQSEKKLTAPCVVSFSNDLQGADSYSWIVDDSIRYDGSVTEHQFLHSGRHTIKLVAEKGGRTYNKVKEVFVDPPQNCLVFMRTSLGDLLLELDEETPGHQDNFTTLVENGFYNGIIFHRVIDGFMIQGGDNSLRTNKGKFRFENEIPHEITPKLVHHRGALAAARMPDNINPEKASSGSQFYIVDGKTLTESSLKSYEDSRLTDYTDVQKATYLKDGGAPQLDGEYTVFGRLLDGFDTLDKIANSNTDNRDKPTKEIIILEAVNIY